MITLLTGKKGSGKTKKLIELANSALASSKGCVVVIEKGLKLTYDISHAVRLVDSDAYHIENADMLFGFISGICAGNYDVTDILVDSTLKITGTGPEVIGDLAAKLEALGKEANTNFVLSVSAAEEDLPASVAQYIV